MFRWTSMASTFASVGLVLVSSTSHGLAQQPQTPPQQRSKPATPPGQSPAAPASPAPTVQRTETTKFDAWQVTCQETDVSKKKVCSAVLNGQDQNRRTVLTWIMARNNEGALVSVLQTPQTQQGLHIQKGVELKLGNGTVRKLNYIVCNQAMCESVITMDDALTRELIGASAASITIYMQNGQPITINLPAITGADKALNAVGRG